MSDISLAVGDGSHRMTDLCRIGHCQAERIRQSEYRIPNLTNLVRASRLCPQIQALSGQDWPPGGTRATLDTQ
jgi:hypothetical protein